MIVNMEGIQKSNLGGPLKRKVDGVNTNPRPPPPPHPNCPRCYSPNTKFGYFNNYSITQPRYFCKTCRRSWTEGGALRDVPIGGSRRKEKRPRTSSSEYASFSEATIAHDVPPAPSHPHLVQGYGYGQPGVDSNNFFCFGGTILTSVTTIQSINQPLGATSGRWNIIEENVTVVQGMDFSISTPQVPPSQMNTVYMTQSLMTTSLSPNFVNMGGANMSAGVGGTSESGAAMVNDINQFNPNWSSDNATHYHRGSGAS